MRPNHVSRDVSSGGVAASGEFGISHKDTAHIMTILRDTLYSNKILAVLREYSANAWDANRSAGREDVPIKVTLPTNLEPTLRIRDFGPGLSPEDIFTVYTQYGASTKRSDDNSVGMLGIGSKSAFAYSDSFTITSWHDGWKRTFVAVLDDSEKGVMNMLHEEACDFEETGVEILVAVRQEDIEEFSDTAKDLFKFFAPLPDINIDLPEIAKAEQVMTDQGVLWKEDRYRDHHWTAVMGCIPYRVALEEIIDCEVDGHKVGDYLERLSGIMYFNIGEVQINASREGLKYSNKTRLALIQKLNHIVDEYVRITIERISSGQLSSWEKRLRAVVLAELKLPIPPELTDIVKEHIELRAPVTFFLCQGPDDNTRTSTIKIESRTRIVLRDDERDLTGYGLGYYDYVVRKHVRVITADPETDPGHVPTWDEVEVELKKTLELAKLEGLPIVKMSTLGWVKPWVRPGKQKAAPNAKHKVRTFRLNPAKSFAHPWSDIWEVENRTPTDDDVYVIIKNFKTDEWDFFAMYREDRTLQNLLKAPALPPIYGYKTTAKKPVDVATLKGKEYRAWREDFFKSLLTPEFEKMISKIEWGEPRQGSYLRKGDIAQIVEYYSKGHPILKFLSKQCAAYKGSSTMDWELKKALKKLSEKLNRTNTCKAALEEIYERYPLLRVSRELDILWDNNAELWADYVKLIDRIIPVAQPQVSNMFEDVADSQEPDLQEEKI